MILVKDFMDIFVFFRIEEKSVPNDDSLILGPNKIVIRVICLDVGSPQVYRSMHDVEAVLHLKQDGTMEIIKNAFQEVVTNTLLVKAYYQFINTVKLQWG